MINRLAEALLREKLISEHNYNKICNDEVITKPLEEVFTSDSVNEESMYHILEKEFYISKVDILSVNITEEVIALLHKEDVERYCAIPFHIEEDRLSVAISNPLNIEAISDIAFITGKKIIPYYDKKINIYYAMENYYSKRIVTEAIQHLKTSKHNDKPSSRINISLMEDAPVIRLTDSIIDQGINEKASDIHLDPFDKGTLVRFRIDGILKEHMVIPKEIYPSMCTRIKIKSGMDISKKMSPQDGKMIYEYENNNLDLRISSIPTLYGEKITIRILNKSNKNITIDNIIYDDEQKQELRNALMSKAGLILVTGPTGSGKSTTLYSLLNDMNWKENNIITIEDPIEYNMHGINQININNKSGLTFSAGLRSILRQDPDIIMIGEIRDEETAEIAIKAAITGHLVLSTLHTNDAFSSIARLLDMKIPSYLVADSLILAASQRLVRKICPFCRCSYFPLQSEMKLLELSEVGKLYFGKGCKECSGTGYKGRVAVLEIMKIDDKYREMIKKRKSSVELRKYSLERGMKTFNHKSKELVRNGVTTSEEIKRVFYEFLHI